MVGLIIIIYQFKVFVNVANEKYLFQKFKKIGYPFQTYGLIGHFENRVKVI